MGDRRPVTFDFKGDDSNLRSTMKQVRHELDQTGTEAERTAARGKKSGDALSRAMKGIAVAAIGKAALDQAEESQQVGARTEAVIKSTGNAAHVSAKQQDEWAQALSKTAAIDDEVINGGANLLRSFQNIKGENFGRALADTLDLAAAKGIDFNTAIQSVGKALNDPIKGMALLRRQGVLLTQQQQDQVKAMVAAGNVAGAQGVLLGQLEKSYGGSAKAMATDSARVKVALQNVGESAGKALLPVVHIVGEVATGFSELPQGAQTAALGLGAVAVAAKKMADATEDGVVNISKMGLGLGLMAAAAVVGVGAYEELTTATKLTDEQAKKFGIDVLSTGDAMKATNAELVKNADHLERIGGAKAFAKYGKDNIEVLYDMRTALVKAHKPTTDLDTAIRELEAGEKRGQERHKKYADSTDLSTAATERLKVEAKLAAGELQGQYDNMKQLADFEAGQADAALAAFNASQALASSKTDLTAKQQALTDAEKKGDPKEIAAARQDLAKAMADQAQAAGDLAEAQDKANGKTLTANEKASIMKSTLDKLHTSTGYWNTDLQTLADRLQTAADKFIVFNTLAAQARQDQIQAAYDAYHAGEPGLGAVTAPNAGKPGAPLLHQDPSSGSHGGALSGGPMAAGDSTRSVRSLTIHVDTMNLGGPHGMRELHMAANSVNDKLARAVRTGTAA